MPTTTGTATDLITFSRGSLATVTDSNGYIKWAPHNLLLASEQFDASNWTKTSATIAANSIAAPDNAITADTIAASGANGTVLQSYTAVAVSYVFGVWLRRKTGTGNIQIAADNSTYTTVTITNDWALYTVTQTPAAGTISAGIRIVTSGDEVYAWGAHLYRSDLGGMQANASAYPYYNPSTPKNLLGYSEAFDNAAWTKGNSSISANTIAAPNGSLSADSLIENTSAGFHAVSQPFTCVSGTTYAWSAYVKPNGRSIVQISAFATSGIFTAEFTLTGSGSSATIGGSGTASITLVGDGWYRISAIAVATAGGTGYWQSNLCNSAGNNNYTGDGTSGVYLWGAQLSDSASLDPYVGSYGAAPSPAAAYGPRLDYDPSTLAAKGLLVEEQRTNLVTYSDQLSNVAWTKNGTTVTADAVVGPDGVFSMDKIVATAANVQHNILMPSIANGSAVYTYSFYAKKAEETVCVVDFGGVSTITATFNLDTGTVVSSTGVVASIISAGNGIYRCIVTTSTAVDPSAGYRPFIAPRQFTAYAGDGTSGIYIYGAQLEAGAFATSYIPTAAATVTRNADVAFVATSQFPLGSTEGTIVTSATPIGFNVANFITTLQDASLNNFVQHYYQSATNLRVNVVASGGTVAEFDNAVVMGATHKVATAFKANDFASSFNGGSSQTDNTGTAPTGFTTLNIGRRSDGFTLNGHIRQITYIPRRLTNAELQARTA